MFNFVKRLVMKDNMKKVLANYVDIASKNVDYVNLGGCGIFAKLFGKKLETMGYEVEYIVLFRDKSCVNEIKGNSVIKHTDIFSCSFTHVILRINSKYYIDADGVFTTLKELNSKDLRNRYPLIINKQLLSKLLDSKYIDNWNNTFTRSAGIKKIITNLKQIN
jgi:hypothetical protein